MEFISKPEWKLKENELQLTGCRYKSHISMHLHSYWLLDGKSKINVSNYNKIEDNMFEFPDLRITSFDMIGNYECVIENENIQGKKIVSKKALFSDLKGNFPNFFFKLSKYFLI